MFKKIVSAISLVLIGVITAITVTGCTPKVTNFSTSDVISNGKIGVIKNGSIYFVRKVTSNRTLTGSDCDPMGIYKANVDENGAMTSEPVLFYSALAGFADGEIYIFGDYIYFTTPAQVTSNTASKLSKRTSFCRVGLDGKNYKVLYTTTTEDSPTYSYYVSNDVLYLVIYENKTLYSVNMAKNCKVTTIAEEVESVALSKTNGQGDGAEKKIFYSKTPADVFITQSGQNIYSVNPDGSENTLISAGSDVTLKEINNGYLYYTQGSDKLVRTTGIAGLGSGEVISYVLYSTYSILSDGGILVKDTTNKQLRYETYLSGSLKSLVLLSSSDYDFLFEKDGYAYLKYTASKETQIMVRISLKAENSSVEKLTEEQIVKAGSFMNYEVIGSTLYYYVEEVVVDDAGKSTTYSVLKTKQI